MKRLLIFALSLSSIVTYSQNQEYVKIKFTNTTDDKYMVIGYTPPLLSVQKGNRKIKTIDKKYIKSINGIECPACYTPYRTDGIVEDNPSLSTSSSNRNITIIKIDDEQNFYYQDIIDLKGKNRDKILEGVMKYFSIKQKISNPFFYSNNDEYFTTGSFKVKYRGFFLMFFNTTTYTASFTFSIKIKDEKLKYEITNIILVPENINVKSYSWFNTNNYGWGSGFTNTKIPTEIPKKKLEVYKNKTQKRHLLFADINTNTSKIITELTETILEKEDSDWISAPKELSSDEAIEQLKRAKEKLELELITQEEYDKIKEELRKYIK